MTMIKGIHSTDHIKKNNLQLIWSLILENQPVSRATLSNLSDLSFVSVSNNVDFLLEQKIIQEVGTSETQRGRPPVLLRVNPECGVIVGVSEEFQQNSYIVTNILGEILEEYFIVHDSDSGSTFLEQLQNEIAKISKKYSNFPWELLALALPIPEIILQEKTGFFPPHPIFLNGSTKRMKKHCSGQR